MADEFRSIRENLFKVLTGKGSERDEADGDDDGASLLDSGAAKALIGAVFARAGKGKDEVVQIIAREIGMAVAAMLKEPLAQLAKNQKLQISFEFVPKDGSHRRDKGEAQEHKPAHKAARVRHRPTAVTKRSPRKRKVDIGG